MGLHARRRRTRDARLVRRTDGACRIRRYRCLHDTPGESLLRQMDSGRSLVAGSPGAPVPQGACASNLARPAQPGRGPRVLYRAGQVGGLSRTHRALFVFICRGLSGEIQALHRRGGECAAFDVCRLCKGVAGDARKSVVAPRVAPGHLRRLARRVRQHRQCALPCRRGDKSVACTPMSVPLVAIDARMTRHMSVGMKAYVGELVLRLPKVATDLRFIAVVNDDLKTHPDMGTLRLDQRTSQNASWGEFVTLPKLMNRMRPVIGHYPTPYAPRWSPFPYAYTIHDLIHRRFPQYHSWKIPPYYTLLVAPVARRAAAVIVPTRATVPDVEHYLGVDPQSVRTVP